MSYEQSLQVTENSALQRFQAVGSAMLDRIQGVFEVVRDKLPLTIAAGTLAVSGAYGAHANAAPEVPTPGLTTLHSDGTSQHATSMKNQAILNKIHHIAIPGEPWKPTQKAWVNPYSAFIKPSAIGFKTDCDKNRSHASWGNYWSYAYLRVTPKGVADKQCPGIGGGKQTFTYGKDEQYLDSLRRLGNEIQASTGLHSTNIAKKISGNRKKIVVDYKCATSPASTSSQSPNIASIVLKSATHKATVTDC